MAEQQGKNWEKQTIEKIAMESLIQQKALGGGVYFLN